MTFKEYKKYTVRTMVDLGSPLLNSIHMVLGIGSEVLSELDQALINYDRVNVAEEIGDAMWYLSNYSVIWGFNDFDNAKVNKELVSHTETVIDKAKKLEDYIFLIKKPLGEILDLDKKAFAYDKSTSLDDRFTNFATILICLESICSLLNLDSDDIRQKNIDKLKLRYPDKFSKEAAVNRDTDAERKVLEG